MEGFYEPGTISARNNNPGNLRSWGSRPIIGGFAQFETPEAGWAALIRQVQLNVGKGLTLEEFFGGKPGVYSGYAPSSDGNQPKQYAAFVAGRTGVDPDTPLTELVAGGAGGGLTGGGDEIVLAAAVVGAIALLFIVLD